MAPCSYQSVILRRITVIFVFVCLLFSGVNLAAAQCSSGELGGTVYKDFNGDGDQGAFEPGFSASGMTVNAYSPSGSLVATSTVASDGTYDLGTISGVASGIRLELVGLPSYLQGSAVGTNSATSVRFVSAASCNYNFAVHNPAQHCDTAPSLITSCYQNGSGIGNANAAIVRFPYTASGKPAMFGGSGPNPSMDADIQSIGSVWGVALQRSTQRAFFATFTHRHIGFGPQGIGGIYVLDYSSGSGTVAGSFTLQGVTPANSATPIDCGSVTRVNVGGAASGDNDMPSSQTQRNIDLDAYDKVGKTSFGDAEISEDEQTLWLINLNSRSLISVDVSGATGTLPGTVREYPLSSLTGVPTCTNGVFRPWAISFYDGVGYLGGVCSAENAGGTPANLQGYILSFSPTNIAGGFATALSVPMNYSREFTASPDVYAAWNPWNAVATTIVYPITSVAAVFTSPPERFPGYAQPILSNIRFSENGSMVLGVADRWGFQMGFRQYPPTLTAIADTSGAGITGITGGDTLFACKVGSGWVLEGGVGCSPKENSSTVGRSRSVTDGPSGAGEYFFQDNYYRSSGDNQSTDHDEVGQGSVLVVPGTGRVMAGALDPFNGQSTSEWFTGGLHWYVTADGTYDRGFIISPNPLAFPGYLGKASGLGEFEALCPVAPIEVGNRVWSDLDGDGVQDPGEPALSGIVVTLRSSSGTLLGTATTDSNGNYLFSSSAGTSTAASIYGITGLSANTADFRLCISTSQAGLSGYAVTEVDSDQSSDGDLRDSDGTLTGSDSCKTFSTLGVGANNHSYDFGFYQPASLGNYVWIDSNLNGIQDAGEQPVSGVTVQLRDADGNVVATQTTDVNGLYLFSNLAPGTYSVRFLAPSGYAITQAVAGSDSTVDSDANTSTGITSSVTLSAGESNLTIDCGLYVLACDDSLLSEQVAIDSQANALRALVLQSLALRNHFARSGDCPALSQRLQNSYSQGATALYNYIWQQAWGNLAASTESACASVPSLSCTATSHSSTLTGITSGGSQLASIARTLIGGRCMLNGRTSFRRTSRANLSTQITSSLASFNAAVTAYPSSTTACQ